MAEIFNRALKYRVILVRGTPACGKTVLLRLTHKYILEQFPHYKVHVVNGWSESMSSEVSESYINQKIGRDPQFAKDSLVFIDDAQSSYYDDYLWSRFKLLEMNSALFVLFSSYGSPGRFPAEVRTGTPPIFCPAQRINLQHESSNDVEKPVRILLDNNEAHDLLSRLLLSQPIQPTLATDLVDYVISISGGHAGALAGLIETIIFDPVNIHFFGCRKTLYLIASLCRLYWRSVLEMDQSL